MRWAPAVLAVSLSCAAAVVVPTAGADPVAVTAATISGFVRIDGVGFTPADPKRALLMTTGPVSGASYAVVSSDGQTVASGPVSTTSRGRWSSRYPDVYPMSFDALTTPGRYRVEVTGGGATATSPEFTVESPAALYGGLVRDGASFFATQRDGPGARGGPLHRRPSHLHDRRARLYSWPDFPHPRSSDVIAGRRLHPLRGAGTVDVAGGWSDAGDYLKFTGTTAYAEVTLLAAVRALGPAAPTALRRQAGVGRRWLARMWRGRSRTLLMQVGIGSGNRSGSFLGDHDLWRLPQRDDGDRRHRDRYAARHRPAFEAAPAGHRISPNLAGRVAAAFGLAAQVDAVRRPARARRELHAAESLYARADTATPPRPLVTALPVAYYEEDTWRDDMELGGAEIALAARRLHEPARRYVASAARWARGYLRHDTGDTLNLYDVSALAHADLVLAIRERHHRPRLDVGVPALVSDLHRQLTGARHHAHHDVFSAAGDAHDYDVDAQTFGVVATAALYRAVTGRTTFDRLAVQQRDWLFGANAWGASFMVGEGTDFPRCMQHQVANLAGSRNGSPPLDVGAVVNGPNGRAQVGGRLGSRQEGMRRCPVGSQPYRRFGGHGSVYVDDVRAYQTVEPALDMTGTAVLAAALQQAAHSR